MSTLTADQFYFVPFPAILNKIDTFIRLEKKFHKGIKEVTKLFLGFSESVSYPLKLMRAFSTDFNDSFHSAQGISIFLLDY